MTDQGIISSFSNCRYRYRYDKWNHSFAFFFLFFFVWNICLGVRIVPSLFFLEIPFAWSISSMFKGITCATYLVNYVGEVWNLNLDCVILHLLMAAHITTLVHRAGQIGGASKVAGNHLVLTCQCSLFASIVMFFIICCSSRS